MNIEHISVSRKHTFEDCPAMYRYHYHDKIQSPEPEPEYFLYGTICHFIAETYCKEKGQIPLVEIVSKVVNKEIPVDERHGEPIYAEMSSEYKKRFPGNMAAIKSLTDKIGWDNNSETELSFSIDLDPPNEKKVVGFIDRLIEKNGQYFIFDYKTTKKGNFRKTPQNIIYDFQLRTYAWVVQKMYGAKAENIKAALYYLEGGDLVGAKFSEQSLASVEKELLDAYLAIENTPPEGAWGKPSWKCKNCSYKSICPFKRK